MVIRIVRVVKMEVERKVVTVRIMVIAKIERIKDSYIIY